MREKILKPYTIVPTTLYIERDADRQLRNILTDMQRPGYVLVSRQMGKTNLLLYAKKTLQSDSDIFVYLDLSNRFNTEKDCFENIIDTAISTHEHIFNDAKEEIAKIRNSNTRSHQKEHLEELKVLLKYVKGKLVIILDEIDALTKIDYSDNIFSQIRSIYFDRINYPQLDKLTYILSGVVEPTEIIKDPRISPFNIGQKIFLNDFSYDEFLQFITKSGLSYLDEDSVKQVFYWTGGNPRMVWDLCYEIEEYTEEITPEVVDNIVRSIYLTTFDKAPVDNIRELVKKDKELREAIIQIQYGKGSELSDKTKNKLYLSGIVNYLQEDKSVKIKNEIINKSLSQEWINEIEEEDKGLIKIAQEQYDKGEFLLSLNTFERYLNDNTFVEGAADPNYYFMGYAAYITTNFIKSLEYLNKAKFKIADEPIMYYSVLSLKGLTLYYLKKHSEGLACLQQIIDAKRKDEIYYRAILNFSSIALAIDGEKYKEQIISNYNEILESRDSFKEFEQKFVNEIKSIAYYNLAEIESASGNTIAAIENINKAYLLASLNTKPTILLTKYSIVSGHEEKNKIIKDIADYIIALDKKPSEVNIDNFLDFNIERFIETLLISYLYHKTIFFEQLRTKTVWIEPNSLGDSIYALGMHSAKPGKSYSIANAVDIFKDLLNEFNNEVYNISDTVKYYIIKNLAFLTNDVIYEKQHIQNLRNENKTDIDILDIDVLASSISRYRHEGKPLEALSLVSFAKSFKDKLTTDQQINLILIDHLESVLLYETNRKQDAQKIASELISKLKRYSDDEIERSYFRKKIPGIKDVSEHIIKVSQMKPMPIMKTNKYGRNDKVRVKFVNSNEETIVKFKSVEKDVELGKCIVIDKL